MGIILDKDCLSLMKIEEDAVRRIVEKEMPLTGIRPIQVESKEGTIVLKRLCDITKTEYAVTLTVAQFINKFVFSPTRRALIQDILFDKTIEERDFILLNITPGEYDDLMPTEDELIATDSKIQEISDECDQ